LNVLTIRVCALVTITDLMGYYNAKKSAIFLLNDFLEMRSNFDAYCVFMRFFIKCITKKVKYAANLESARTDDDLCTVSDEAFALLLLENSWGKWTDQYRHDPSSLLPRRGGRQKEKQQGTPVPTKYTKGGHNFGSTKNSASPHPTSTTSSSNKGWSDEGIQRYNELFDLVQADRRNHPEFFDAFLNEVKQQEHKDKKQKPTPKKTTAVRARHNLFKDAPPADETMETGEHVQLLRHAVEIGSRNARKAPVDSDTDEEEEEGKQPRTVFGI